MAKNWTNEVFKLHKLGTQNLQISHAFRAGGLQILNAYMDERGPTLLRGVPGGIYIRSHSHALESQVS